MKKEALDPEMVREVFFKHPKTQRAKKFLNVFTFGDIL